jgi:hypothetical protein
MVKPGSVWCACCTTQDSCDIISIHLTAEGCQKAIGEYIQKGLKEWAEIADHYSQAEISLEIQSLLAEGEWETAQQVWNDTQEDWEWDDRWWLSISEHKLKI